MSDFTREEQALHRLKDLMTVHDQGSAQLSSTIEKAVADDFFKKPRRALTRIYEKIEILKAGSLDVQLYEDRYHLFDKDLEEKTNKLREIADKAETMDGEEWVEAHVEAYSDFLYILLYIAVLEQEIDLQCKNYIKMMDKIINGSP